MQTATGKGEFSHVLFIYFFNFFFKPQKFSEIAAAGCPRCAAVPQNALMSQCPAGRLIYPIQVLCGGDCVL